jgi:thioesterase domain-containing protein
VAAIVDGQDAAQRQLIAYVAPRGGADEAQLKAFLRGRLPGYMIPQRIVALDTLPLTAAGKIDRRSLPAVAPLERVHSVPPRDDLERRLLELWRSVLNVPDAGVTDDFFELGGHSLLAVELMSKAVALEIPLAPSALIHATTVRELAAWIRRNPGTDQETGIVQLQPNGKKTPICWIHSAGGDVLGYRLLARLVGADRPVVAIETRGPAGGVVELRSIEDLAQRYAELLIAAFPTGPWYVGGHSVGGLIALEMAGQLTRAGYQVPAVFLLDTVAGRDFSMAGREQFTASLHTTIRHCERVGVPAVALRELPSDVADWKSLTSAIRAKLRSVEMPDALRTRVELACQHLQAAAEYVPPAYAGRVVLYQPQAEPTRQADWLPGTAQRVSVPGDHFSLLEPPHVDVLSDHLRQVLADEVC